MSKVKVTMLLTSLIMLMTSNTQSLNVNALNEATVLESYSSNYSTLNTVDGLYNPDEDIPDVSTLYYTNMGYRKHMIHLYNDEVGAHNITKQLFPYEHFVETTTTGIDYIPVIDSEGNQKYSTFYYDHYSENIHVEENSTYSYMEFTIEITGMENALNNLVNTYKDSVKTQTLFEIPLVYIDNQEICGFLVDTSSEDTNIYMYSKYNSLKITAEYGYYFLTFQAPYQATIYDITLFNYSTKSSLEDMEAFEYKQTWTTFLPATWMADNIQPMLFEILDYDRVNHQFMFGHSAFNANNNTYVLDFDDYNVKSLTLDMYEAELTDSGTPGSQSTSGTITIDVELVSKSEDGVYTYEVVSDHLTLYESHLYDAGQVVVSEVDYVISKNGTEKAVTYKHTYGTNLLASKFKYCKNPITKIAYIQPYKLLAETSGLQALYKEEVTNVTKHSNNIHYLGSVYEPKYNLSNTMFAQSFGFNLSMDELNYKKIKDPFEINFDYKTIGQETTEDTSVYSITEEEIEDFLNSSYFESSDSDMNCKVINHNVANELLDAYSNYNGIEFEYSFMDFFNGTLKETNLGQLRSIRVRYNTEAYETTKINATGEYTSFGSYIIGSSDENAQLYEIPSYNQDSNNQTDNETNEDNDNNATLKDFLNKENLLDNLKSIFPIALGLLSLLSLITIIIKKKK